jgi:hypothetical protein
MNWDALGAMGELFGALAVVLTLGYLAVQVKQNSQGMKFAAKLEIEKSYNEFTDLLLRDSELFELHIKGMSGQDLNAIDDVKYSLLMSRATRQFSSMYYQYQNHDLSDDEWHETSRLIRWFTLAPGYRSWWKKNEQNHRVDFRNYLSKVFKSDDV